LDLIQNVTAIGKRMKTASASTRLTKKVSPEMGLSLASISITAARAFGDADRPLRLSPVLPGCAPKHSYHDDRRDQQREDQRIGNQMAGIHTQHFYVIIALHKLFPGGSGRGASDSKRPEWQHAVAILPFFRINP
jgi:hypothetical protein